MREARIGRTRTWSAVAAGAAAALWVVYMDAILGARLKPDTGLYSSGWTPRSPLGSLAGLIGGLGGVIALSAIGSGIALAVTVRKGSPIGIAIAAGAIAAWGAWPGMDAAGAALVLLAVSIPRGHLRGVCGAAAGLVHPVAGLTWLATIPATTARQKAWCALLAGGWLAFVVGALDTFATVDRYLLPGALLLAVTL